MRDGVKSRAVVLALALGVAVVPEAMAGWGTVAGAGASIPWGQNGPQKLVTTGFGATWGALYRLESRLEVVGRVVYTTHTRDDDGVLEATGLRSRPVNVLQVSGGDLSLREISADVRYFPSQGTTSFLTHPYLLAAAGVTAHRYGRVEVSYQYAGHTWLEGLEKEEGVNASLAVGAGLRFDFSPRMGALVEGRYQEMMRGGENLRSAPIRLELYVLFGAVRRTSTPE